MSLPFKLFQEMKLVTVLERGNLLWKMVSPTRCRVKYHILSHQTSATVCKLYFLLPLYNETLGEYDPHRNFAFKDVL